MKSITDENCITIEEKNVQRVITSIFDLFIAELYATSLYFRSSPVMCATVTTRLLPRPLRTGCLSSAVKEHKGSRFVLPHSNSQMMPLILFSGTIILFVMIILKVREEQEKRRLEEEQQSQLQPAQQQGQQSNIEVPQSQPVPQPASYVLPQPNQHGTTMSAQTTSQQSLQGTNYNTPQITQPSGLAQGVPYVPQSTCPVPVQGQTLATIQPEPEEPVTDQQLQHTGGGVYQTEFLVRYNYGSLHNCESQFFSTLFTSSYSHSHGRQTYQFLSPPRGPASSPWNLLQFPSQSADSAPGIMPSDTK